MRTSFAALEKQRLARCRLLTELRYRRLPRPGGWSHYGLELGTEPTSLALLALRTSRSSPVPIEELAPLLACRRPNGLWPAVWDGDTEADFWASAIALNTLMILGAALEMFVGALDSLLHCQPLEASWLVRLKFRIADRQVRLDPTKFGWPWVPDTMSWVEPTSMVLIALERAKALGLIHGDQLWCRLNLGTDMLLDRVCPQGGWNAGNGMVYGVPLRPHLDATALALAALRFHWHRPTVNSSLTWMLNQINCSSAYSMAWLILSATAYKDCRSDVLPVLDTARERLAALVEEPQQIQDTSTIALAALALDPETANNPLEVRSCAH